MSMTPAGSSSESSSVESVVDSLTEWIISVLSVSHPNSEPRELTIWVFTPVILEEILCLIPIDVEATKNNMESIWIILDRLDFRTLENSMRSLAV